MLLSVAHALCRCKYEEIANALFGQIGGRIVDIAYDEFFIFYDSYYTLSIIFQTGRYLLCLVLLSV